MAVGFWEMAGLNGKNQEFWNFIKSFEVSGLMETWLEEKSSRKQRNLKQKFIALLKRFRQNEGLGTDQEDMDRKLSGGDVDPTEIEDFFEELEDLSESGPEMDTMSISSTPKPSLRPFFSSSRSLLHDNLNAPAYYNALYYGPSAPTAQGQKVPLIVNPHGGPHSATINEYGIEPNFLVKMGFAVLMVNYRGSTGVGQDGIEFLPGKIGDTDVKDNHEAVNNVLKDIPYLDEKNVFLFGGSHGGFLVGQLSAQYPDFYRAVVSRNPVTDVYAMYFMSDIPDWATGECGLDFDESKPLTVERINKMIASSPNHLADKIKAPTLFLIGKNDLRVPYYEGIKMYNALKARKQKVRLHLYDDNHTLGGVPNHIDGLINAALWFTENKA